MTTDTRRIVAAPAVRVAVTCDCEDMSMRVCIVYDCLFPYTVGGAERWYRNLAERIVLAGHDVTLLTLRQWERGSEPDLPGVRVVSVGPRMALYTRTGRRRIVPPVLFGVGVLAHLLRRRDRYDVVHTASFPYFSLLAIGAARRRGGYRIFVDWHEVWTHGYWREYLGQVGGRVGWRVQQACLRVPQRAFCFSRLHERRLRELGLGGSLTRLEGQYVGASEPTVADAARPVAVFAGRHIPEKQVPTLIPAIALAREEIPDLRGEIYGDGPERKEVVRSIAAVGLDDYISAPGFVDSEVLERALSTALCLVLPSRREGYGLVVVEAASRGVPTVAVDGSDNAATELVEDGVNGRVAASATPTDLARAIVNIHAAGSAIRVSTADWFRANAARLSISSSLECVLEAYADA
jgi:glycosyltransferase involved in cell wall biosynthesis